MMEPIEIVITGKPVPKGRPQAFRFGNGIKMRTPKKTANWEEDARMVARHVMKDRPPLIGPLSLSVRVVIAPAYSWAGWKKGATLSGEMKPTSKPDLDNVVKAAKDAMNGILWIDDAQVVRLSAAKTFGSAPMVVVTATPEAGLDCNISSRAEYEQAKQRGE